MVKCVTNDLEVPANAEIALEGLHREGRARLEGPFGDHTATTRRPSRSLFPRHRNDHARDAVYPSIVVGKPPQEDAWLGKATERIFSPPCG